MKTNLEILLGEWGRIQAGQNRTGLGLPSSAAFTNERVQQGGREEIYVLMADDDVRRLDDEIRRMHPDMRTILTAHYVWSGPLKCKLPRLALSKSLFYFKLDYAHQHLSHSLGGRYQHGYESICLDTLPKCLDQSSIIPACCIGASNAEKTPRALTQKRVGAFFMDTRNACRSPLILHAESRRRYLRAPDGRGELARHLQRRGHALPAGGL